MLLFVNACLRDQSRTERLARMWLDRRAYEGEVVTLTLADSTVEPLDAAGKSPVELYSRGVGSGDFSHPLFDYAKQFAQADEVLIAAPIWNYSMPAKLHAYLELVCSQGVTFDVGDAGAYVSLVKTQRLTYVTTAGGLQMEPEDDHAFGYVSTLAQRFWHIPRVDLVAAWGLDAPGADVEGLLEDALG